MTHAQTIPLPRYGPRSRARRQPTAFLPGRDAETERRIQSSDGTNEELSPRERASDRDGALARSSLLRARVARASGSSVNHSPAARTSVRPWLYGWLKDPTAVPVENAARVLSETL